MSFKYKRGFVEMSSEKLEYFGIGSIIVWGGKLDSGVEIISSLTSVEH
jgi:hypothetical protein